MIRSYPAAQFSAMPAPPAPQRVRNLKVVGVDVCGAGVVVTEDVLDAESLGQRLGEAGAGALAAVARVVVLGKGDVLCVGRRGAPLGPAGRVDDVGHGRVLDVDTGVLGPGAAEVVDALVDVLAVVGGNGAVVEHVPRVGRVGLAARGGDVADAGLEDANVAVREPGLGCLTEDEVGGSDDKGLGKEEVTRLGEDGVLVTDELAGVVTLVLLR